MAVSEESAWLGILTFSTGLWVWLTMFVESFSTPNAVIIHWWIFKQRISKKSIYNEVIKIEIKVYLRLCNMYSWSYTGCHSIWQHCLITSSITESSSGWINMSDRRFAISTLLNPPTHDPAWCMQRADPLKKRRFKSCGAADMCQCILLFKQTFFITSGCASIM